MQAVADGLVGFSIRLDRQALDIRRLHVDLLATASDGASLVIDEGGRQNAPEPTANRADVPQLPGALERPKRELLQQLFGLVPAAYPMMQKDQKFFACLDKRSSYSRVRWLRGFLSFRIISRMLGIRFAPICHRPAKYFNG